MYDDRGTPAYIPATKRSFLITAFCFLEIVLSLLSAYLMLFDSELRTAIILLHGRLNLLLYTAINLIIIIPLIAIWRMKRWGVIFFAIVFICGILHTILTGYIHYWPYIPGVIILFLSALYWNKMSNYSANF